MLLAEMKIDGEEGSCEGRGRGPCVLIPQNLRNELMLHYLIQNSLISQTKHPTNNLLVFDGIR
jgi:hypothetical protein